jgi:hypothetical protein
VEAVVAIVKGIEPNARTYTSIRVFAFCRCDRDGHRVPQRQSGREPRPADERDRGLEFADRDGHLIASLRDEAEMRER